MSDMTALDRDTKLDKLFDPDGIAIAGASRTPGKVGHSIVNNLKSSEYEGKIFPVNPNADKILSLKCYSSISEIPHNVDVGVIAVPAKLVSHVAKDAGEAGVDFLVIVASGFSEVGNLTGEKELLDIARDYEMRILGPNIFGIYYGPTDMNATFGPRDVKPGNIALISQSGALGVALIEKTVAEEIGLSAIASLGNKADITEVELLEYLKDESSTEVIVVYLEGTKHGRELLKVARETVTEKPIVLIKAGRSKKGATAAASHTGSLAGSDRIYDAAFKQGGILRARSASQAFNWAQMMASQPLPEGNNNVIITNGGGVGVLATDACEQQGLRLIDDQQLLADTFSEFVPSYGSTKNPVDMTGMATAELYEKALDACFESPKIDSIVVLYCIAEGQDPDMFAQAFESSIKRHKSKKPVSISMLGGKGAAKARRKLSKKGIPAYEEPEDAVEALGALYRWKEYAQKKMSVPQRISGINWNEIRERISDVRKEGRVELLESESRQILDAVGLELPSSGIATTQDQAVKVAREIDFPVVLKVESKDIVHKTEAGGVKLDLKNEKEVRAAYKTILSSSKKHFPRADIKGVSVTEMIKSGIEIIIGSSKDPSFGPTLMFGLGGIYVEVLRDVVFRVAPITKTEARQMVSEINSYPLLLGIRGEKKKDVDSLIETIYRIGQLVYNIRDIVELDINPLKVQDQNQGCQVLDCSISISEVEE